MLSDRLQDLRINILSQPVKHDAHTELLEILQHMDTIESQIGNFQGHEDPNVILSSIIIAPGGNRCNSCGRTLKIK